MVSIMLNYCAIWMAFANPVTYKERECPILHNYAVYKHTAHSYDATTCTIDS